MLELWPLGLGMYSSSTAFANPARAAAMVAKDRQM